ncbi:MAG: invasin domain 3-containing protein, partial [Mariniphaga sp.]
MVAGNVSFSTGVITSTIAASTLSVGGTWTGTGTTFTPGSYLTVDYNGTAQTISPLNYYNLTLSGSGIKSITDLTQINGDFTMNGNNTTSASTTKTLNVVGNMTVNTGNSIYLTNGNPSLIVGGNTTISGTVTSGGAAKTFGGNLTINSTGSWTDNGYVPAYNFAGNLINNGSFSAANGPCTFSGSSKTIGGTISITSADITGNYTNTGILTVATFISGSGGTLTQDPNSTLNIEGTSTISTLTATANGNTINYTGAAQTVFPTTYNNLTLSGTGAKVINTAASGTLANGTLNIDHSSSGTATASVTNTSIGVHELRFSNALQSAGTWGSTSSSATHTDNANFTSGVTGYLNSSNGTADATQSTLTPTTASITADGASTQILTIQAKDANGNNLTIGGSTVTITNQSGTGSISSVTDNSNGTYTATVTAPTSTGSGVFVATLGGLAVKSGTGSQTQSTISYIHGAADATNSTLTPTSATITANGISTQVLTVTAKDVNNNFVTSGGATVTITKSTGSGTIGSVADNGNGTYTSTVTSPTATGSGIFVATLSGNPVKSGTGSQTQST